ncbi:MAG: class I SAM-dependent methyltransferase [Clostridia bacterium]|nr:class I SAM-dependent methyltransferase [Clostridia bacterium]
MRTVQDFSDYELIDADNGERLERWKDIILIRPDPQIIWSGKRKNKLWNEANAIYHRSNSGGGYWEKLKNVPDVWNVSYNDLTFRLKPMGFKHTGLFPEQAVNWKLAEDLIKNSNREISVLNLFAYTGGATVACLKAGASVTHVDASKGMVNWAKENANVSGVIGGNVRWLVDDCMKFVAREIRRGKKYDAVIMDPPSYGRGPNGEVWKLEQQISDLLKNVSKIMSYKPLFFFLNSYTGGLSPTILNFMVKQYFDVKPEDTLFTEEIGLNITEKDIALPCGATTVWIRNE